jgi:chemotaxis protein histidine kinase CheA
MPESADLRFPNEGLFSEASIQDFLAEADEQLAGVEEQLLALEENRASRGAIVEIFRHLHGLKGNTGLLLSEAQVALPGPHPLYYLQKGSHAVESAVDQFRKLEAFRVSDEEIAFLFEALDFLQRQIRAFQEGRLEPVKDLILLGRLGLSATDFDTAEAGVRKRSERVPECRSAERCREPPVSGSATGWRPRCAKELPPLRRYFSEGCPL